ncbi:MULTISPECIES: DUF1659 domain-containing protein [unclassified Dehalobacter]|uniref:DUF1659 domain-containing protein n=1 Tax=unclassified Dehalobacter TaxID=2635733 RepID=UPI0003781792|nr:MULTISPECIES: DUF1659 domain-containing protein [unclassified Dehalobacter]RJE47209.1 hypothetical protein A7K50_04355 [Dehalobacter sp. MCB1]TCX53545.1 DUF1659 domain-containing protein [Dehalobacter sp. 14DCB1]TCX54930.1 DUF1659 domain-containing protein [Dehalobacter sp. 12DCB1]
MTLVVNTLDSVMATRYQTGTTAGGAPVLRQKSLTGVKATATDQDVYDVAVALSSLVDYPLTDIRRLKIFELTDE